MYHFSHVALILGFMLISRHIVDTRSQLIHNLTSGFNRLPFNNAHYIHHTPYNLPLEARYSFINDVHKLWVFSNDKAFRLGNPTFPRSELSINGYKYSSGVWQFEAYVFVPRGTSGVSLMQVFGADPPFATTLMVRVYDGKLYYYRNKIISYDIYDTWFRLNVIHDVEGNSVNIYINGVLKYTGHGRGGTSHYFKFGVYGQLGDSFYMESRWKDIKILKKSK